MADKTEKRYNPETGAYETAHVGAEKDSGELADELAAAAKGTTAGKGLGNLAKKPTGAGPAPKMEPGESPADFSARYRKWRDAGPSPSPSPTAAAQAKALRKG